MPAADQDPLRAARDLDVAWIVDGSLQRRGDQLRVTARLLRAADGSAAWSGSFDEKFTGVFEVQDAISARVAQVLAPSLQAGAASARARRSAGLGGTRNTDAYQLYLAAARSRPGHARRRPAQEHRAVPAGARRRPRLRAGLGGACRNASANLVRRRRRPSEACSSRPMTRCSAPWRSCRTWPKRVPSRPSSSIGSTSIGPAPNASSGARSRSIRTSPWLTSVWPACC